MYNLMKCEVMKLKRSLPLRILSGLMLIFAAVTSLSSLSYVGSPYQREMEIALTANDAFFSSLRDMPTIVMIERSSRFVICADFENRATQSEIAAGHAGFRPAQQAVRVFARLPDRLPALPRGPRRAAGRSHRVRRAPVGGRPPADADGVPDGASGGPSPRTARCFCWPSRCAGPSW